MLIDKVNLLGPTAQRLPPDRWEMPYILLYVYEMSEFSTRYGAS